ncbi:MAG: hypothetical protein PHQ53_12800 [Candidatus Krumholzibacteria bacterium]|nr:hypothetical protein [Candidatus Krumholzibacteria bacterium]
MAAKYEVIGGTHVRNDGGKSQAFNPGDEIEPTAIELESFPDRFRKKIGRPSKDEETAPETGKK